MIDTCGKKACFDFVTYKCHKENCWLAFSKSAMTNSYSVLLSNRFIVSIK